MEEVLSRINIQTLSGGADAPIEGRGDCVRACITSILGLPINAIENCHGENWWSLLRGELCKFGYDIANLDLNWEPPLDAFWIASVPSLNLGPEPDGKLSMHCVVARGYTLIHDPALGDKYNYEIWSEAWNNKKISGWVLIPLNPAKMKLIGDNDG